MLIGVTMRCRARRRHTRLTVCLMACTLYVYRTRLPAPCLLHLRMCEEGRLGLESLPSPPRASAVSAAANVCVTGCARRAAQPAAGRAVVCGGGPAGSLAAVYLARLGYAVDVCEQRALPDPLRRNLDRSYHLAMSHRGMGAVERARPPRRRAVHAELDGAPEPATGGSACSLHANAARAQAQGRRAVHGSAAALISSAALPTNYQSHMCLVSLCVSRFGEKYPLAMQSLAHLHAAISVQP